MAFKPTLLYLGTCNKPQVPRARAAAMNQPAALGVLDIKKTKGLLDQSSRAELGWAPQEVPIPTLLSLRCSFRSTLPSLPTADLEKKGERKTKPEQTAGYDVKFPLLFVFFFPEKFILFPLIWQLEEDRCISVSQLAWAKITCPAFPYHTQETTNYLSMLRKNI